MSPAHARKYSRLTAIMNEKISPVQLQLPWQRFFLSKFAHLFLRRSLTVWLHCFVFFVFQNRISQAAKVPSRQSIWRQLTPFLTTAGLFDCSDDLAGNIRKAVAVETRCCGRKSLMQFVTTSVEGNNATHLTADDMDRARRKNSVQPGEGAKTTRKLSLRRKSVILRSNKFDDSLLSFREADSAKRQLKSQLQWLSKVVAVLGVTSVVLAIIDIELNARFSSDWAKTSVKAPTRLVELLVTSLLSAVSLATCVFIQRIQAAELRLLVVKNIYHKAETVWSTSLFPCCLVETLVCLFHVPPMCNEYGVPYKLQLLVFLRTYLLTRYVKEHSRFTNNKSTVFFASVTKTEITSTFLVKAYFLKYPFQLIAIVYSLNVFLGGYFVYVVEETLSYMVSVVCICLVLIEEYCTSATGATAFWGFRVRVNCLQLNIATFGL